jgi:hypothetical protein
MLAALPRMLNLHPPLGNAEAAPALLALAASRGDAVVFANPAFGLLQAVALAIFGASDASARAASALAGTLLCLLPIALRADLGRVRALIFGALLALSPTLWFVSRQADGAMLAWLLAFGAFCAWRARHVVVSGIALGALLANGSDAVLPALAVALALLLSADANAPRPNARFALAIGAAFAITATGALLRPSGLGDAFNGYAAWVQNVTAPAQLSFGRLAAGFVLYEPVAFLGAIAGVALLLRAGQVTRLEMAWLGWLALSVIATALSGQRGAATLVPAVIGCAALAAYAYGRLAEGLMRGGTWSREGVIAGAAFVVLLYAGLGLWQYAGQGQTSWLYPILIAGLLILAMIAAGSLGVDSAAGLRGTALALAASLLLWSLGAGLRMTHVRPNNPGEPYRAEAVAPGLAALVETIRETGVRATGEPGGLDLQVAESAPPALRWALRDQEHARFTAGAETAGAALTPEPIQPAAGGNYIGNVFEVVTRAPLPDGGCALLASDGPTCQPLARWLTSREAGNPLSERWLFWLREDVALKAGGQR